MEHIPLYTLSFHPPFSTPPSVACPSSASHGPSDLRLRLHPRSHRILAYRDSAARGPAPWRGICTVTVLPTGMSTIGSTRVAGSGRPLHVRLSDLVPRMPSCQLRAVAVPRKLYLNLPLSFQPHPANMAPSSPWADAGPTLRSAITVSSFEPHVWVRTHSR
jgi:hypothetical protein